MASRITIKNKKSINISLKKLESVQSFLKSQQKTVYSTETREDFIQYRVLQKAAPERTSTEP